MKYGEHQFQAAAYAYIRAALPDAVVWSTDHAGKRTPIQGARLKQRGIVPGIPDMFVLFDGRLLALELKAGKGQATDNQSEFLDRLYHQGARCRIVWSIDEIQMALENMDWSIRATTMTAQDRDARLSAKAAPKASRKRAEKPAAARVRKATAIYQRYLPPEPVYTGPLDFLDEK